MPVKILVVDDEADLELLIRQRFRKQIKSGEYVFAFAGDGIDALENIGRDPDIDIVLTDINMPRMDGLTLLDRLSGLDRLLMSVVVSAYGDMDNIRTAMNRGSFDFLTKPIDMKDLEITVNKARDTVHRIKDAAQTRKTFGRYLSDTLVTELLSKPDAVKLGGELRVVTLLMSDLRGFSLISEQMSPDRVVEMLNVYLGRMVDVIQSYNGLIDNFIGDGILVVFGAPVTADDDAARAVACALEMQRKMKSVNEELESRNLPRLEMGIGLDTGPVVVGNIGSKSRMKYSVVGSHVNLASRIESFTVGEQILISGATKEAAAVPIEFSRQIEISAKGFKDPVAVYDTKGIGAPFDLKLEETSDPVTTLNSPVPIALRTLDGKHVSETSQGGELVALGASTAIVRSALDIEDLTNIVVDYTCADGSIVDLYGKVVEVNGHDCTVRFTGIPASVSDEWSSLQLAA